MIREAYLESIVIEIPGLSPDGREDDERARTARNFRPSGSDDRGIALSPRNAGTESLV